MPSIGRKVDMSKIKVTLWLEEADAKVLAALIANKEAKPGPAKEPGYVYWNPGDPRPRKLPKGCEWSSALGNWFNDSAPPLQWGTELYRRWPRKG